jgi:hypothetical protein
MGLGRSDQDPGEPPIKNKNRRGLIKLILVSSSTETVMHNFQFIDLGVTSAEQQRKNRTVARSHAMRVVRGRQRKHQESTRASIRKSREKPSREEEEEEVVNATQPASASVSRPSSPPLEDWCSITFAANMTKSFKSASLPPSHRDMIEYEMHPLQLYSGKLTPFFHAFLDHSK